MADTIRQVDYFYLEVPDKPGEGFRVLTPLKEAGVNLLAFCAFPTGAGKVQIDFVPENPVAFGQAAAEHGLSLSDPKRAFLIQGEDRAGAVAEVIRKLATEEINIVASQAVAAESGRWAMMLWVKPADYDRASKALEI
jgi:hypothetical protein